MADELVMFDSTNPYQNLDAVTARSPDELVIALKSIRRPIKIISIVGHNNRVTAFIIGDFVKKRGRPPGTKKDE